MTQPFQASLLKFSTKFLLIKAQFYWYSRQAMVIADQCVKIGDSMQTLCKSGVPQKSVFGPLLLSFSQTLKLSSNDKPNTASPHYQADNKIISLGTLHQLYFHSDQACSFPLLCPCYQCSRQFIPTNFNFGCQHKMLSYKQHVTINYKYNMIAIAHSYMLQS